MAQSANSTFLTAKLTHGFRIETETWADMDRKIHVLWSVFHGSEIVDAGYEVSCGSVKTVSDRLSFRNYVIDVASNSPIIGSIIKRLS